MLKNVQNDGFVMSSDHLIKFTERLQYISYSYLPLEGKKPSFLMMRRLGIRGNLLEMYLVFSKDKSGRTMLDHTKTEPEAIRRNLDRIKRRRKSMEWHLCNRIRPENLKRREGLKTAHIPCFNIDLSNNLSTPNQAKSHHANSPSITFPNLPSSKILLYFKLSLFSKIAYVFACYESIVGELGEE